MGTRLLLALGIVGAACGQTMRDSTADASAGAAGTASGGIAGVGAGPTGGGVSGGGGMPIGGGGVVIGGGGTAIDGSAGLAGGGGVSGGASGGAAGSVACSPTNCKPDEYCAKGSNYWCGSFGTCEKRPKSCPGECDGACSCGGEWCSVCVSRMFGHDATPFGSNCMADGGGPNLSQAGLGQPCGFYWGVCVTGLKCCYPCQVAGCQTACMQPDVNGMCPTITPSP